MYRNRRFGRTISPGEWIEAEIVKISDTFLWCFGWCSNFWRVHDTKWNRWMRHQWSCTCEIIFAKFLFQLIPGDHQNTLRQKYVSHDYCTWPQVMESPQLFGLYITCILSDLARTLEQHRTTMLTLRKWRWSPFLVVCLLIGGRIAFQEPTLTRSSGRWWVDSAHVFAALSWLADSCRRISCFPVDLSFWCLYTPFNIQEISQVGMKSIEKPERQCNFPTLSSCSFEAVSDINFPLRSALHWF